MVNNFISQRVWLSSILYLGIVIGVMAIPSLIIAVSRLVGYEITSSVNATSFTHDVFWFALGAMTFIALLWFVAAFVAWLEVSRFVSSQHRRLFEKWMLIWFGFLATSNLLYRAWPKTDVDGYVSSEDPTVLAISYLIVGSMLLGATRLAQKRSDKKAAQE